MRPTLAHILYPLLLSSSLSTVQAASPLTANDIAALDKRNPGPNADASSSPYEEGYMSNARRLAEGLPLNPPTRRAPGVVHLPRASGTTT